MRLCKLVCNQLLIIRNHNLYKLTTLKGNSEYNMSTNTKILEQSKIELKALFYAGVKSVSPKKLIDSKVKLHDDVLYIEGNNFAVTDKIYMVGFGKAVMGMALALERILGDRLVKGIISVPKTSVDALWESDDKSDFLRLSDSKVEYREGAANNQPDDRSLNTTHAIIDLVESLTEKDTLLVLISGGGSALLYMPRPTIDPDDKIHLCKLLQNAGADIKELNTVRKKLSMVKGGGLARMAFPASVITLILSDIIGDPIDLIASGPTVYSSKSPDEVIAILKKYNLFEQVTGDVRSLITSKETFNDKSLLKPGKNKAFKHVNNILLGNNSIAIEAARKEALRQKITPIVLQNDVSGDVHEISLAYTRITSLICLALQKALTREEFYEKTCQDPVLRLSVNKVNEIFDSIEEIESGGVVLIAGGEPTVTVRGKGKGGRNQELALYFSLDWLAKIKSNPCYIEYDVIMLSGGTDGQDGPTDAAGAFGYPAIGPIMHKLYSKLKSAHTKALAEIATKAQKIAEAEEKKKKEKEQLLARCKTQELSNYLNLKSVQKPEHNLNNNLTNISNSRTTDSIPEDLQSQMLLMMEVERMLPENVLKENDSYNFYSRFKKGSDLLKTGYTNTNVMDLHFIYIKKRSCCCEINFTKDMKETKEHDKDILNEHDLHIDPVTIEKFKALTEKTSFDKDPQLHKSAVQETEWLNIKIVDDNLADPCCNKTRKSSNSENV